MTQKHMAGKARVVVLHDSNPQVRRSKLNQFLTRTVTRVRNGIAIIAAAAVCSSSPVLAGDFEYTNTAPGGYIGLNTDADGNLWVRYEPNGTWINMGKSRGEDKPAQPWAVPLPTQYDQPAGADGDIGTDGINIAVTCETIETGLVSVRGGWGGWGGHGAQFRDASNPFTHGGDGGHGGRGGHSGNIVYIGKYVGDAGMASTGIDGGYGGPGGSGGNAYADSCTGYVQRHAGSGNNGGLGGNAGLLFRSGVNGYQEAFLYKVMGIAGHGGSGGYGGDVGKSPWCNNPCIPEATKGLGSSGSGGGGNTNGIGRQPVIPAKGYGGRNCHYMEPPDDGPVGKLGYEPPLPDVMVFNPFATTQLYPDSPGNAAPFYPTNGPTPSAAETGLIAGFKAPTFSTQTGGGYIPTPHTRWWKVQGQAGKWLNVTLTSPNSKGHAVEVFTGNPAVPGSLTQVAFNYQPAETASVPSSVSFATTNQLYYIMGGVSNMVGQYNFSASFQNPPGPTCADAVVCDNSYYGYFFDTGSIIVTSTDEVPDSPLSSTEARWFKVTIPPGKRMAVAVLEYDSDPVGIGLYTSCGGAVSERQWDDSYVDIYHDNTGSDPQTVYILTNVHPDSDYFEQYIDIYDLPGSSKNAPVYPTCNSIYDSSSPIPGKCGDTPPGYEVDPELTPVTGRWMFLSLPARSSRTISILEEDLYSDVGIAVYKNDGTTVHERTHNPGGYAELTYRNLNENSDYIYVLVNHDIQATHPSITVTCTELPLVKAGSQHGLALRSNGSVSSWGANFHGQLGFGNYVEKDRPTLLFPNGVRSIATNDGNGCMAVIWDGTVKLWGRNEFSELGGSPGPESRPTPATLAANSNGTPFNNVKTGALGNQLGGVVLNDGTVWMWGLNNFGGIGNGTIGNTKVLYPTRVETYPGVPLTGVKQLAIADNSVFALKTDGTVWCWGDNRYGCLGDGSYATRTRPSMVLRYDDSGANFMQLPNIVSIVAGCQSAYAIDADGKLWSWGDNGYGKLGDPSVTGRNYAKRVKMTASTDAANVTWVESGVQWAMFGTKNGEVWTLGTNTPYGCLGLGTTAYQKADLPVRVINPAGSDAIWGSASYDRVGVTVGFDGQIRTWGTGSARGDGTFCWCVNATPGFTLPLP